MLVRDSACPTNKHQYQKIEKLRNIRICNNILSLDKQYKYLIVTILFKTKKRLREEDRGSGIHVRMQPNLSGKEDQS